MKSRSIRHLLAIAVCSVIYVCSLESCSKSSDMHIIFENETSDTVVVTQVDAMTIDSLYRIEPFSLPPSMSCVVIKDYNPNNHIPYSDVAKYIRRYFPNGLNITFQSGKTLAYHPDSIATELNSPYDEDSYGYRNPNEYPSFLIGGKSDFFAYYTIKDNNEND
jgi:hypothetical protein